LPSVQLTNGCDLTHWNIRSSDKKLFFSAACCYTARKG
jgi:hypothetical protein